MSKLFATRVLMTLFALVAMLHCGTQTQQQEAQADTGLPTTVVQIQHPQTTQLEIKAREEVETQRLLLDDYRSDPQTHQVKLGQAYGDLGSLYYAFSFRKPAETALLNAAFLDQDNGAWAYLLGRLYEELNQTDKALFWLEHASKLAPEQAAVMVHFAFALRNDNQIERAEAIFNEVLAKNETCAPAYWGLAQIASSRKDYETAMLNYEKVLALQPFASIARYPLALAAQAMGQTQKTEFHMKLRGTKKPIMDDPYWDKVRQPMVNAHYRMAEVLRISGHNEDAITHYDHVVDLDPMNPAARLARALNLISLGLQEAEDGSFPNTAFLEEALWRLQQDTIAFPNQPNLKHLAARLLAASPNESIRDGQKALQIMHELGKGQISPEMVETLAMAFAEVRNYERAIFYQERALALAKQMQDEAYRKRLENNMKRYKAEQPCRLPWPEDDPIFRMVTYKPPGGQP